MSIVWLENQDAEEHGQMPQMRRTREGIGGMTLDREKKIAEIRDVVEHRRSHSYYEMVYNENHEKYIRFLLDELERLEREYAEERAAHNAHVTELCQLEEKNRKLREERDEARSKAEEAWKEIDSLEEQLLSSQQEIEQLREERDKLIEGLRWYADYGNWFPDKLGDGYIGDHGEYARNILKEIGVMDV